MADSTIEFELIRLSKPGSSSLFLDAQGKIKANALLPATIRSFPLAVHYREQLLGRTVMPDITLSTGGDTGFATSALMEIADMSTFNQFGQDMIHAHSLSWRLSGSTVVGVLGLSYSIKFDKVVAIPVGTVTYRRTSLQAFDGLKHVNIEAFDLASSNETNINTRLNVSIFNPSVISILHMDIMYKGSRIAMAHTTERVNMDVGANYLMMEGTVLPQNISLFEEVIGNYLRGLPCNVTAVAGMHSGLILEANFTSMQLVPVNSTSALLSANVSIVIDPLLGNRSLLEVEKVALGVDLIYVVEDDDAGPSGAALLSTHLREAKDRELVIGHIQTDQAIVPTGQHGAIVNITIDHQYLQIEGDQITANFIEFVVAFIQRPQRRYRTVNLKLVGTSDVTVRTVVCKLEASSVPVNNSVVLPGLDNLPNVTVLSFDVPRDSPNGGMELAINFTLTNPSFASFYLPAINFGMFYRDTYLGYLNATGVQLNPGLNRYRYTGLVKPAEKDLGVTSEFLSNYLTGEASSVVVRGLDAGNSSIGWLQKAATGMVLSTDLPGIANSSALISSVVIQQLAVNFSPNINATTVNISMTAGFNSPFGIKEMSLYAEVLHGGALIGGLTVPMTPIEDQSGNLTIVLTLAPLRVMNATFAHELLINNRTDLTLRARLLASVVSTSIGDLNIKGVPIQDAIELKGANQFKDSITINTVALLSGSPKGLTIGFNITVQNPLPNVAMNAGNLFMKMRYKNVVIAEAEVAKFNLGLGTTTLSGEGLYTRPKGPGSALAIEFISGFISGANSTVTLTDGVTDIPVLAYALGALNISTEIPGNASPLIQKAHILGVSLFAQTLDVVFFAYNPYDAYIALDFMNFTVYLSGRNTAIGKMALNLTAIDKVIYLPGRHAVASAPLTAQIGSFGSALETLLEILLHGGKTNVDIKGEVHILVFNNHKSTQSSRTESYGQSLRYEQQNIPAILFGDHRR
ncbi:uncharacterized protein ACA1_066050 [Acanthamoeba castellanii str. Neff]|uniref:Uncharacterized protein n=1 Tax=Acanthamoeba castellanii (strain ATCC 30010 / Neff) TaxID=1257118 RepID=L8GWZ5_ACACF|nr:uncharacterized protein ACA1_066050 [Acanthamoeba castellanii str. Neff]ELR17784.1 hypothetical protein ACA1_066050 [Acanthamoeba castellanii str. Neff]